jgi:hypothetical protein
MKKLLLCLLSYGWGLSFFASGQPLRTTFLPASGTLRITNDSVVKDYTNITLRWQLYVNGLVRQKGRIPGLTLLPHRPRVLHLPLKPPAPAEEAWLRVEYRKATPDGPEGITAKGIPSTWIPWTVWGGDITIPAAGNLDFTDSNDVFTVTSPTLHASFDKQTGWLQQYIVNGLPLVTDTNGLRPALAETPHLQLFSSSTGPQMVIIRAEYTVPELSCLLHLSYTLNAAGALLISQMLETDTTRQDSVVHPIDRFGLNWTLPPGSDSIAWYGVVSDAAHVSDAARISPDAAHASSADSVPTLHTGPLSAGVATLVRWWAVVDPNNKGARLTADSNLLYRVSWDSNRLQMDNRLPPHPSLPIRHQLSVKLTPLFAKPF